MAGVRLRTALLGVGIVAALICAAAFAVLRSQEQGRADLRGDVADRAAQAGRFTAAALLSDSMRQVARAYFAGPAAGLPREIAAYQGRDPLPRVAILDARGRVLAADPPALRGAALARTPAVRAALAGRSSVSNVFTGPGGARVFDTAFPYRTRAGRRVVVTASSVEALQTGIGGYLRGAPAVEGGRAYLLDGRGQVLASSNGAGLGRPLRDAPLRRALRRESSGDVGERVFVSETAPGTDWRMVFAVPREALYAPVEGSTRVTAWLLFAAFVFALLALLGVGAAALLRSARLAHERLHDSLTGLPTRALFLDRVDRALAGVHRHGVAAGVLFVDLDRFKRVNDGLGHAAGDEVLVEVARRLGDVVRWVDTVSRFGGDEFLVLCEELNDEHEVLHVASRIQETLAEPIVVGEEELTVDCSIGIAMHRPGDAPVSAAQLVQDSDAAMYRAKRRGRARVEVFGGGAGEDETGGERDVEAALRAVLEVADWEREGLVADDFVLAYQVSPQQLSDPAFPDAVAAALRDWPLPPSALRLAIGDPARVDPGTLERLERLGVGLVAETGAAQSRASATITPKSSAR